jgi:prepilin-type N-terminal cleavage/methylation domain-containing protein
VSTDPVRAAVLAAHHRCHGVPGRVLDQRTITTTVQFIAPRTAPPLSHRRLFSLRARRGLSLLELTLTLALLAVVVVIAVPTYRTFERNGDDNVARSTLKSVEAELTRLVSSPRWEDESLYKVLPSRLLAGTANNVAGVRVVDQATASANVDGNGRFTVSVRGVSGGAVAVIKSRSGSCFYTAVRPGAAATSGSFTASDATGCRAGSTEVLTRLPAGL